jgi:dephospho-CoA kinase
MAHTYFKRIGLTGGIGSGKSTLAGLLMARGLDVIDADALSHQLTAAKGAAMPEIQKLFGSEFMAPDGSLAREPMRALVFEQPQAKEQLQSLLHPMIFQLIEQAVESVKNKGKPLAILDIPLLVESRHWRQNLDRILVVDCSAETQIRRVTQRSQMSAAEVKRILANQASRAQRLSAADWVVANDTDDFKLLEENARLIQLHI